MRIRRRKRVYKIRGCQVSKGKPWTKKEEKTVRQLAGKLSTKLIAYQINRTYESVRQFAKREGISLKNQYDDIQVGRIVLPYVPERYGWMKPDGKVTRNPLIAQRVAEELNERAKRCA